MTVKTRILEDSESWLERLLQRFQKQSKTSSEDLEMCQYTIDIIKDRIREKDKQHGR